jgi:gliding motility-associated-like protein
MKRLLFVSLFSLLTFISFANHTKGGWMYYEYLGPGSGANTSKYRITLKLYTECTLNPGQTDDVIPFTVFNALTNAQVYNLSVAVISDVNTNNCTTVECHPCINNIPSICYKIRTYQTVVDLPNTPQGYIVAYQRCCRISGIRNIQAPSNQVGETWTVKIPGTSVPGAETNSSARFAQNDTAMICMGNSFTFDFSATDINNDSLVYTFTPAYAGGSNTDPVPPAASNPPFATVPYAGGYSGGQPLGSGVTINPATGIVTGIAPTLGVYVITVTVSEYKRGTNIKIAEVRKSLHIEVTDCSTTEAVLRPDYTSCDGFTLTFTNGNNNNIQTFDWEFGDGNSSTQSSPTHTYADTGIYILKLVVNRGLPCSDSTTAIVKVYPGFFPDFEMLGQCKNIPVQFNDLTTATYGAPNKWEWNFGDPASPNNTSTLQNPTHIYTSTGSYDVVMVVHSNKGCYDTVRKTITILDQPVLSIYPKDTLICIIDTLQLNATGSGTFLWSPNYMISNVNAANPLVSPDVTTTYFVNMTDAFGCTATDSVRVNVKSFVTLFGGPDTTICRTDSIILNLTSDALNHSWTENPAGNTLNDPTLKNPTARPLVTTTYTVVGNIGKCIATDQITVTPVPYPVANAGPDQTICFGQSTQLNASGGSIYAWSPNIFLNAANIPNPVVTSPTDNVRYIVTVRDVLGCPKPVKDTMMLFVAKIVADAGPRDTSIVLGQPLQLGASGGPNYAWTPTTWLNDPTISNPIANPLNNIEYVVRVSNNVGCFDTDSIRVKVFKIKPDLYVPNAFSPNGDGNNDIFKPIPIGMKSLDVFMVYNRWGQMVYSGTGNGAGWDGRFLGKKQEAATFVWYAEGVDYLNNKIKRKGSVVLIR